MRREERRAERRAHARVPAQIVFASSAEPFQTRTINLSASGAYCAIPESIPTMARMKVSLVLPLRIKGRLRDRVLDFSAVVVRTEKREHGEEYRAALCFWGATERQKRIIRRYLKQQKPELAAC
jgi:c-di-GMP-binding flagellar brake protein YcgR